MAVILVTDGEQRSALAAVRSLGRAGHEVYVASAQAHSLAGASRYARGSFMVPGPLERPQSFALALVEAVRHCGASLLFPMTEASILALTAFPGEIPARIVALADQRFARISDKALVLAEARAIGIATPAETVVAHASDHSSLGTLVFPVVVKPSRSVAGGVKLGVRHAADLQTLEHILDQLPPEAYPVLVQQRVVGPGVGIFVLLGGGGQVLARFAHRRIREKPPAGGVSVYRESIAIPEALYAASLRLLRRFDWEGVAMVEYKLDAAGTPYLMEINGRFWGSLQLAVDAGVDFPALLARWALGASTDPVLTYREGVRSRWWWGDVDHLIARFRRTAAELALPPGAPSRPRAFWDFLTSWGFREREEIFRWSDPMPFLRESWNWVHGR